MEKKVCMTEEEAKEILLTEDGKGKAMKIAALLLLLKNSYDNGWDAGRESVWDDSGEYTFLENNQ